MRKVFVLGSINMDYSIAVDGIPALGESKNGHGFYENQGGKGANQAVALAKFRSEVYLIGSLGNDQNGKKILENLKKYKVNVDFIRIKDGISTGACVILLDDSQKDNILIVDRGANDKLLFSDVKNDFIKTAEKGDIFISQLEVNIDSVFAGMKCAKENGLSTILNPAPVCVFDQSLYKYVDLLILNETETALLSGTAVKDKESALKAFQYFHCLGVKEVIVTMGKNGSYYLKEKSAYHQKAYPAETVDTTCAGDTFIGILANGLAEGKSIMEKIDYASFASSITVSRKGAANSIPAEEEVNKLYEEKKNN